MSSAIIRTLLVRLRADERDLKRHFADEKSLVASELGDNAVDGTNPMLAFDDTVIFERKLR